MNTFRSFFFLESKRFLSGRNLVALVGFFILSLALMQTGVNQYKYVELDKDDFQEAERLRVKEFINYEQYGGYGFGILFMPSKLSTFFNNTSLFTELSSKIDVGGKLTIYNSLKGKNIFAQKPGQWLDFAEIILLFGSFMALYFGYESLRHREYVKFLSTLYNYPGVFWNTCLSRVILFCLFFVVLVGCAVILLFINGIRLAIGDWVYWGIFLLIMLLLMVFFFSLGTLLASIRTKIIGLLIFLIWFLSVFFIPGAINKAIEAKSNSITSNYRLELEKFKKLMDFERRAGKEMSKAGPGNEKGQKKTGENPGKDAKEKSEEEKVTGQNKSAEELAESYRKSEFSQIQKIDKDLMVEMKKNIRRLHKVTILFPTAFYLAANKEISSRGYRNVLGFYEYAFAIKEQFVDFYRQKRYSPRTKTGSNLKEKENHLESFIKKDENIFVGTSGLPFYFGWGILVSCVYIALFFSISYLLYRRSLFLVPEKKKKITGLNELNIEVTNGESNVVLSRGKTVYNHFYNVLYGKNREFKGKIFRNDVDLVSENRKNDFVYICHSEDIPPNIKTGDFLSFMGRTVGLSKEKLRVFKRKFNLNDPGKKYFKELDKKDKGHILLEAALLKKSDIYIIYDFSAGMPPDFLKGFIDRLEKLKKEGPAIIYFTDDIFLARKIGNTISVLKKDAVLMSINI